MTLTWLIQRKVCQQSVQLELIVEQRSIIEFKNTVVVECYFHYYRYSLLLSLTVTTGQVIICKI